MRSILLSSVLALAACDQDQNEQNDRTDAPGDRTVPPGAPGDAAPPMGRPDMPADHPPMGHDMGRGDMGRGEGRDNFRIDPSDPNSATVEELVATLSGDPKHKDLKGTVTFKMQGGNTLVDAQVDGLPKGEHGYHVHMFGDCSDLAAKSPGEHLDFHAGMGGKGGAPGSNMPTTTGGTVGTVDGSATATGTATGTGSGSGAAPKSTDTTATDMADASGMHVVGNLGELQADASGRASGSRTVDARLRQLLGRAVVIHEKGNDDTKPDGAAGDPIACGVIGISNPAAKASASTEPEQKK